MRISIWTALLMMGALIAGFAASRLHGMRSDSASNRCSNSQSINLPLNHELEYSAQCSASIELASNKLGLANGERRSSPGSREISEAMELVRAHCPAGTVSEALICQGPMFEVMERDSKLRKDKSA